MMIKKLFIILHIIISFHLRNTDFKLSILFEELLKHFFKILENEYG